MIQENWSSDSDSSEKNTQKNCAMLGSVLGKFRCYLGYVECQFILSKERDFFLSFNENRARLFPPPRVYRATEQKKADTAVLREAKEW